MSKARLSTEERARLLGKVAARSDAPVREPAREPAPPASLRPDPDDLSTLAAWGQMQVMRSAGALLGIDNPFLQPHDARAGASTWIDSRELINFSSYNYLGLNGHPAVSAAAKAAIDRYGTTVSASRVVAGERPIHRELERRLAALHGAEDAVAFVSGHATNTTVIGHLMGPNDLILHDALIHNSVTQGALLSGARRLAFPHNDAAAAERLLVEQRGRAERVLIVIEGLYSMDGDSPDGRAFADLARREGAWLMVDEAHSLGVLGAAGRGIGERDGLSGADVHLWMGTLSKTLAGCGGYIAARADLVEYLKLTAPGFVYSVGLPPPIAGAAIAALDVMAAEPERVARLNHNSRRFLEGARAAGLDTGPSEGLAIVPVITGSSIKAAQLSQALARRGVNVQPILHPAVAERAARLRFFLSSEHTDAQIDRTLEILAEEAARPELGRFDAGELVARLSGV